MLPIFFFNANEGKAATLSSLLSAKKVAYKEQSSTPLRRQISLEDRYLQGPRS